MPGNPVPCDQTRNTTLRWLIAIVGITLLAYLPIIDCNFIWDDPAYVVNNPTLRDAAGLWRIWMVPRAIPQYYPLVHTMFWVEYHLWGLSPLGYHLVNVLLHLGVAVAGWRVLRLLKIPGAPLAALLFAIHPVHVESVAWITERKNVLSGLFYFLAAYSYLRFALPRVPSPAPDPEATSNAVSSPGAEADAKADCRSDADCHSDAHVAIVSKQSYRFYGLSLFLFLMALWSKTTTSTLPAALVLVLWWKHKRFPWRDLLQLVPFFIMGIGLGLHTAALERDFVGAVGDDFMFSGAERILIAGRAVWFYLWKLLWPRELIFFYPYWKLATHDWIQYLFPASAILMACVLLLKRKTWTGGPLVAYLFFLGTLFPALGFFNVYPMRYSFVADHFQYLASWGILSLLAAGVYKFKYSFRNAPRLLRGGQITLVLGVCLLAGHTAWQIPVYHDQESLWTHTIKHNPTCWAAIHNLSAIRRTQRRFQEAIQGFKRALALRPKSFLAYANIGDTYALMKQYRQAETAYRKGLKIQPGHVQGRLHLSAVLRHQGKWDEALAEARECVRRNPRYANAWHEISSMLLRQHKANQALQAIDKALAGDKPKQTWQYQRGQIFEQLGKPDAAAQAYQRALQARPRWPLPHDRLAVLAMRQGDWAQAEKHFIQAYRLDPQRPQASANMGALRSRQHRWAQAITWFKQAHQLDPANPRTARSLAWLLATAPGRPDADRQQALTLLEPWASKAATPPVDIWMLDTRAAAYAGTGQFDRALKTLNQALTSQAAKSLSPSDQKMLQHRKTLYQQHQAYVLSERYTHHNHK